MAMNYDDDWNDDEREYRRGTTSGEDKKRCNPKFVLKIILGIIIGAAVISGIIFLIIFIEDRRGARIDLKVNVFDYMTGKDYYLLPNNGSNIRIIGQRVNLKKYKGKLTVYINGKAQSTLKKFYKIDRLGEANVTLKFRSQKFNKDDFKYFFRGLTYVTSINFDKIDTSKVEDMTGAFKDCPSLTSINLDKVKTDNVKSFESMFENCINLKQINLYSKKTSKVETMASMFRNCYQLVNFNPAENFATRCKSFGKMFQKNMLNYGFSIKGWNMQIAKDFEDMFGYSRQMIIQVKIMDYSLMLRLYPNLAYTGAKLMPS